MGYTIQYNSINKLMEKRKRRCEIGCNEHSFEINNELFNKLDISIGFCPKYHRHPNPPQNTYPVFNSDQKYFTSAFILGTDRKILERSHEQQLAQHNKQIKDCLQKQGAILFPRPNKKHTLCSVCKQKYKNYYTHIMSQSHKNKINANNYNSFILQLQQLYKDLHVTIEAPVPIQIVDIARQKNEKSTQPQDNIGCDGLEQQAKSAARKIIIDQTKKTQIIPKEIIQYIISSDEQNQDGSNDSSNNVSDSSESQSQSDRSSEDSSSDSKSQFRKIQNINLESDSDDSVQIICAIQKVKVSKKIQKKSKNNKGNKHKQKHKSKKDSKKKHKKYKKSDKIDYKKKKDNLKREESSSSSSPQINKSKGKIPQTTKKAGPVIPPVLSFKQQLKKIVPNKMKYQPHPDDRPQAILIQKSQINDPVLQASMNNILGDIVADIRKTNEQLCRLNTTTDKRGKYYDTISNGLKSTPKSTIGQQLKKYRQQRILQLRRINQQQAQLQNDDIDLLNLSCSDHNDDSKSLNNKKATIAVINHKQSVQTLNEQKLKVSEMQKYTVQLKQHPNKNGDEKIGKIQKKVIDRREEIYLKMNEEKEKNISGEMRKKNIGQVKYENKEIKHSQIGSSKNSNSNGTLKRPAVNAIIQNSAKRMKGNDGRAQKQIHKGVIDLQNEVNLPKSQKHIESKTANQKNQNKKTTPISIITKKSPLIPQKKDIPQTKIVPQMTAKSKPLQKLKQKPKPLENTKSIEPQNTEYKTNQIASFNYLQTSLSYLRKFCDHQISPFHIPTPNKSIEPQPPELILQSKSKCSNHLTLPLPSNLLNKYL